MRDPTGRIVPHGGKLVDLMVTDPKQRAALFSACEGRRLELSDRNACDVELLTVGRAPAPRARPAPDANVAAAPSQAVCCKPARPACPRAAASRR